MKTPITDATKLPLMSLSHREVHELFVEASVAEKLEVRARSAEEEVGTLREQVKALRGKLRDVQAWKENLVEQ